MIFGVNDSAWRYRNQATIKNMTSQ